MKFLLISDLDDTIKISNTQKKLITLYRGIFRKSAFAGMAELYQELITNARDTNDEQCFFLVSSSPPTIRKRIEKFLSFNRFPPAQITLRDWLREKSIPKFKQAALTTIANTHSAPILLIGDDTEHDPEIFTSFSENYPDRILNIYIRSVKDRALPKGARKFYTAFDIACTELEAGRLTQEQVYIVGNAVLNAEKHSWLIPDFMKLPPIDFIPFFSQITSADQTILELWKKIQEKIFLIPRKPGKK